MHPPILITVAVPSLDQGRYLAAALDSIFDQDLPVEVFVADGGSSDGSVKVIKEFSKKLAGWRAHPDSGQAAAINECIARGKAPYVCWLNSDDMLLPGGLAGLLATLEADPSIPAAYGRAWNLEQSTQQQTPVRVEPFDVRRLARRCIISQPATLIRRSAWEAVGGLDERLHFGMDYDLWWRLYLRFGELRFVDCFAAVNREHARTKSRNNRFEHYRESAAVVRQYHAGSPSWTSLIPLKLRWRLALLKDWVLVKTRMRRTRC